MESGASEDSSVACGEEFYKENQTQLLHETLLHWIQSSSLDFAVELCGASKIPDV